MMTLRLPRLGGTRDAADDFLDRALGLEDNVRGETVVLLGRDLVSSSESFADQIVRRLLSTEGAAELVLVAPPRDFERDLVASSQRRGLRSRVRKETAASLHV